MERREESREAPAPAPAPVGDAPRSAAHPAHALALQLQRSVGNRATGRLLSRWWNEAGKWGGDGKPPTGWVERTRTVGKSPYYVPPERAAELDKPAPAAAVAVAKPAYVEPVRNTTRPPKTDKRTRWWVPTSQVLYSQDSVTAYFTNDWSIGVSAQKLKANPSLIEGYAKDAPLEVWTFGKEGERLVSFDNRRLWVMKHAGVAHVPVVWAASPDDQAFKLTAPGGQGSAFITVVGGLEKEFKGLTAQKPAIDDPTINKLKYAHYW